MHLPNAKINYNSTNKASLQLTHWKQEQKQQTSSMNHTKRKIMNQMKEEWIILTNLRRTTFSLWCFFDAVILTVDRILGDSRPWLGPYAWCNAPL